MNQVQLVTPDALPGLLDIRYQTALMLASFGGKCNGRRSQTATLTNGSNTVIDASPDIVLPAAGQPVTITGALGLSAVPIAGVSVGSTTTIQTTIAHQLTNGQSVVILGLGSLNNLINAANGTQIVTVIDSTHFTIPVSTTSGTYVTTGPLGGYVMGAGGCPTPLYGYVSNPVLSGGTLTFSVVSAPGGSTPVNWAGPSCTALGWYDFGDNDNVAWNAALAEAASIAESGLTSSIAWFGCSMVSETLIVPGGVTLIGLGYDYINPDGAFSNSGPARRGSIIRAHGNFANASTSALVQLGTTAAVTTGLVSPRLESCMVDGNNIVMSAKRVLGSRAEVKRVYALNGAQRAHDWQGSNMRAYDCVGGMPNSGDTLYCSGSDSKWMGASYLRQGTNQVHLVGAYDFDMGPGAHLFSGAGSQNTIPGSEVFIEGASESIGFNGVLFDECGGPHIRLNPGSGFSMFAINFTGCRFFQFAVPGNPDSAYPVMEIDTHTGGGTQVVNDVTLTGWTARASQKYKSIIDVNGSGAYRIALGPGAAHSAVTDVTYQNGALPQGVTKSDGISLLNGSGTRFSKLGGQWSITGDGSTTVFTFAHLLAATPLWAIVNVSDAIGQPAVTVSSTNITLTFATAPPAGTHTGYWYAST